MAGNSSLKQKGALLDYNEEEDDDVNKLNESLLKIQIFTPKKKLLILSIGGLLCHRVNRKDRAFWSQPQIHRMPDATYGSYKVYRRPHCEEFVKFCLERFEVGIWASAREWYLDSALDGILPGLQRKILFAWDQETCTDSGFKCLENKMKPVYLKELSKVWNFKFAVGKFSKSNTLLIDNDPYKALLNPPNTAIFPNEYKANYHLNDNALGRQGELRLFMEGLAGAEDVPSYVKQNPFGKPAISPEHPDWNFYSEIIQKFNRERVH
jgi:hypothetical protein